MNNSTQIFKGPNCEVCGKPMKYLRGGVFTCVWHSGLEYTSLRKRRGRDEFYIPGRRK